MNIDTDEFVNACYMEMLKREPDPGELQDNTSKLESGAKPSEIISAIINSREFQTKSLVSLGVQNSDITNDTDFNSLYEQCKPFSISSMYNMYALYKAVEFLIKKAIPGDIVECGVWRGGSSMLAAHSLMHFGDTNRTLYLYDTYAGMSEPGEHDIRFDGARASDLWTRMGRNNWWPASLDEVRTNLLVTGYPADRIKFVEGRVEETIPGTIPSAIALLRLDTDWYESTLHELRYLFPQLSSGGVVILDDYGWWTGSKKAAEEYFHQARSPILLNRIDMGGARLGIKV